MYSNHNSIALVARKYFRFGGKEQFLESLMQGLVHRGYDVHIIATKWESETAKKLGVTIHPISITPGDGWMRAWSFAKNVGKFLSHNRFDCVVSLDRVFGSDIHISCDGCFREMLARRQQYASSIANIVLHLNPRYRAMCNLEKKVLTSPLKAIVAVSDKVKQEILRYYPVRQEKIQVVRHGISPHIISTISKEQGREFLKREFAINENEIVFLYVGSDFERKGVAYILKALAMFPVDIPLRLVVIGQGKIAKYRQLAKKLAVTDKVIFTGPRQDVPNFYRAADAFVLPTLYEPFGLACLEAMLHRLPVIVSKEAGACEVIQSSRAGIIVQSPRNPEEIYKAMTRLLDGTIRECMGREGEILANSYTLEHNIERILQIIHNSCYRLQQL